MALCKILVGLFTVLYINTAPAKVLFIAETGFIVENKVLVNVKKEEAWQIFTQHVDQWWPADHTWWGANSTLSIDTTAGGCFCETFEDKSAEHMRITFVEPNQLLRMTGGLGPMQGMGMFGALNWTFKTTTKGTEITMTYKVNGINPEGFTQLAPIVDSVQGIQLSGLKQHIGTLYE